MATEAAPAPAPEFHVKFLVLLRHSQNIVNEGLCVENSPLLSAHKKSPPWILGGTSGKMAGIIKL